MKARALASEVGVRMASRDKLLADTGLIGAKTKTEQDAEAARLNAGPLVGEAGASAVPAIVDPNDAHEVAVHQRLGRLVSALLARSSSWATIRTQPPKASTRISAAPS